MLVRMRIGPDGQTQVESLSTLEDLWQDFQFFRMKGAELDQPSASPSDRLIAKRYHRAGLLTLVFYLEGVVNHWLKRLLPQPDWPRIERQCLEKKIDIIQARVPDPHGVKPDVEEAKGLRNMLAHVKPGEDIELYDKVTGQLLEETEASVTAWLGVVEDSLGLQRHPDARLVSRNLTEQLGTTIPETEGYTGSL